MFTPNVSTAFPPATQNDTQYNFARPNGFQLVILNLPGVTFNCQTASVPRFATNSTPTIATPFNDFPVVGTESSYEPLELTFLIDEKFYNYRQVYDWMKGIYFPQAWEQFDSFVKAKSVLSPVSQPNQTESFLSSDLHLIMLDSDNNRITTVKFLNAFPTSLASIPFSVTQSSDYQYLTAAVSFAYTYYTFED